MKHIKKYNESIDSDLKKYIIVDSKSLKSKDLYEVSSDGKKLRNILTLYFDNRGILDRRRAEYDPFYRFFDFDVVVKYDDDNILYQTDDLNDGIKMIELLQKSNDYNL